MDKIKLHGDRRVVVFETWNPEEYEEERAVCFIITSGARWEYKVVLLIDPHR